jgi:hypothetical protein
MQCVQLATPEIHTAHTGVLIHAHDIPYFLEEQLTTLTHDRLLGGGIDEVVMLALPVPPFTLQKCYRELIRRVLKKAHKR